MNLYNDGSEREALIMHAGGFKMPRSKETAKLVDIGDGTMKSYDDLWMDGSKVFNFVQKEVPPLIEELLSYAEKRKKKSIGICFISQINLCCRNWQISFRFRGKKFL